MRLTFLRHAESEFNVDSSSTSVDCPLSSHGFTQASELHGHWDLVLVSPLKRAQQTLESSKITFTRVEIWSSVREQRTDPCDFLEGELITDIETDQQLMDRADQFLVDIQEQFGASNQTILIISHCEFIHAITAESPHNAQFVHLDLPLKSKKSSESSLKQPPASASIEHHH